MSDDPMYAPIPTTYITILYQYELSDLVSLTTFVVVPYQYVPSSPIGYISVPTLVSASTPYQCMPYKRNYTWSPFSYPGGPTCYYIGGQTRVSLILTTILPTYNHMKVQTHVIKVI